MGIHYTCDGCKKMVSDHKLDLKPLGVMGNLYCKEKCAEVVEGYLSERDIIHDDILLLFRKKMETLNKKYIKKNGMNPPDFVDGQ